MHQTNSQLFKENYIVNYISSNITKDEILTEFKNLKNFNFDLEESSNYAREKVFLKCKLNIER